MAIASVHEVPDAGIPEGIPGLEKAGKRGKWYLWYLWYALAWAPFAVAYYAVFVIVARAPFISASTNALRNVVPASLLRHVLHVEGEARDEVRLNDEWHFTSRYLALEQLRLETRLHIVADLDPETLDCLVPAFSLQPIVENAVRHGIAPTIRGGSITIRG